MKKTDKLFELIKSMSMAEKRYFKIFAGRHTIGQQNNYIKLFEILEQMDSFDGELLLQRLKESELPARHLSSDKNYLYNLILKGLSAFNASKTTSLRIKEKLHQVEILFDRGLYQHCLDLMKKAKVQARKYDLYPLLVEISLWQRKIWVQLGQLKEVNKGLEEVLGDLALMDNMHAFMNLYYQMKSLQQEIPKVRSEKQLARFKAFITHPFLEREDIPLSFQAKIHFWQIYAAYYYATEDRAAELDANRKLIAVMNEDENYLQEFPYEYVEVYSRILSLHMLSEDKLFYQEQAFFLSFPERIKKARRNVEARVVIDAKLIEFERDLKLGNWDAAGQGKEALTKATLSYKNQILKSQWIRFYYFTAFYHVALEDFSKGLKSLNTLLNEYQAGDGGEVFQFAEILFLITHFHLRNYTLMKSRANSLFRSKKRNNELTQNESIILKFFQKLARTPYKGPQFVEDTCTRAKEELIANMEEVRFFPTESHMFLVWLDYAAGLPAGSFAEFYGRRALEILPASVETS